MADRTNDVRSAVITYLKSAAPVTAKFGQRIYDEVKDNPDWPFIRYGLPSVTTYETSCGAGSEVDVTLHVFAKGPGTSSVALLCKDVIDALDGAELDISAAFYGCDYVGHQIWPDSAEKSAYHGVIRFRVVAI